MKTLSEINKKIRSGDVVVVGAHEMPEIVSEMGVKKAAKHVDVVTTGTFGAMCSSGAFLNFGHSDPPIKIQKLFLNEVEAYAGLAAVDAYIGATQMSQDRGMDYGGGHVIEDMVSGKRIDLNAISYGTDCYPLKKVKTSFKLSEINQAVLYNPRNNYQRYVAATNSSDKRIRTYMGTLLPNMGNVNFAGTGHISPLLNDPEYLTLGFGTKIFLGGAIGRIVGEGTQHSPQTGFGTISVQGNLKKMSSKYLRGATIPGYGTSLMVGIGVPIPVLNEKIAKATAVTNDMIKTNLVDYGIARMSRPVLKKPTYAELMSGMVELKGQEIKTAPLSSLRIAYEIMDELKKLMEKGGFQFSNEVESLPLKRDVKPMPLANRKVHVKDHMTRKVITAGENDLLKKVSSLIVKKGVDQIPIVDGSGKLKGIVTTYDITKAASENKRYVKDVMTSKVVVSTRDELIEDASSKILEKQINSTPVVDSNNKVVGIITLSDINRAYEVLGR